MNCTCINSNDLTVVLARLSLEVRLTLHVYVYSNSRNDVPRVAQRYGTIAAHTRRRASVLVVFVVFCVHMHSFADLIRRTPPPTFRNTAITDRHSDTTIFQLRAHWCGYPDLLDRKNRSDMCPWWESNPRLPACKASTLCTRPGSPLLTLHSGKNLFYMLYIPLEQVTRERGCLNFKFSKSCERGAHTYKLLQVFQDFGPA